MQQNKNWPFSVNEMMNPYFDAYTRFVKNVFALEPVVSSGIDKNNFVEKQFDIFIKNAHHTLDYMKEMMFIFEHNLESNLARSKSNIFSSMNRGEDVKPFTSASPSTTSSTKKNSTKGSKSNKKSDSKLSAKTGPLSKQAQEKTAKKLGSSSLKESSVKKNNLKKEPQKKATTLKASDHPFSLGERNKELLDKNFKPMSSPSTKNSLTDKKI